MKSQIINVISDKGTAYEIDGVKGEKVIKDLFTKAKEKKQFGKSSFLYKVAKTIITQSDEEGTPYITTRQIEIFEDNFDRFAMSKKEDKKASEMIDAII